MSRLAPILFIYSLGDVFQLSIVSCHVVQPMYLQFNFCTSTEDFFTSYDEVCESFDNMGLKENLLRGIYAYGIYKILTS